MAAIDDIRAKPWLLDFFFQSLLQDALTRKYYGEKELLEVKNWILDNEIAVTMAHNINNVKMPHISIEVADGAETMQTLGDINVDPDEKLVFVVKTPPVLVFTPASYNPTTGTIVLPAGQTTDQVFPGMRVLDRANNVAYQIQDVPDSQTIIIPTGINLNLTRAEVVNTDDLWTATCESVAETETFNIDCVMQGDATKTLILQSLVKWILYRYKRTLLEARGYENTVVRSSGMAFSTMYGKDATQLLWKRAATVTGFTMTYWPRDVVPPIQGINLAIMVPAIGNHQLTPDPTQSWSTVPNDTVFTPPEPDVLGG